MRFLLGACRGLVYLFFALVLVAVAGAFGLRYWVSPNLNNYRPQIQTMIGQLGGPAFEMGALQLDWQGWNPVLQVNAARLRDSRDHELLFIPELTAGLDWRGLWADGAGFFSLKVSGMDLQLRRRADGSIGFVAVNQPDGVGATDWGGYQNKFGWLLRHSQIAFEHAQLRWLDQQKQSAALVLDVKQARLARAAPSGNSLLLTAEVKNLPGTQLELRAKSQNTLGLLAGEMGQWEAWLQLSGVQPDTWRDWLEVPDIIQSGNITSQLWLQSAPGQAGVRANAALDLQDFTLQFAPEDKLSLARARIWAFSQLEQVPDSLAGALRERALDFQFMLQDAELQIQDVFDHGLFFTELTGRGQLKNSTDVSLDFAEFGAQNQDIALTGQGGWRSGAGLGTSDFSGHISRANLARLYAYLPLEVDADARQWLQEGLLSGEVRDAGWYLRGDLAEFPFGAASQAGDFRVWGGLRAGAINFIPWAKAPDAWPLLEDINGFADLHRVDLRISADSAQFELDAANKIELANIQARIASIDDQGVLDVAGLTRAPAAAYLKFMQLSPLGGWLGGIFDQASGSGQWQVPLELKIPLLAAEATQVNGSVKLSDASLKFLPSTPAFSKLKGSVEFDENGVNIDSLDLVLLGGKARLAGRIGARGDPGLALRGELAAAALKEIVPAPGMRRLAGRLAYEASLAEANKAYVFKLHSDGAGLALDLPAPMHKTAEEKSALDLELVLQPNFDHSLLLGYGKNTRLRMDHAAKAQSYYQNLALGMGMQAPEISNGMALSIKQEYFDLDAWRGLLAEFTPPPDDKFISGQFFPDLQILEIAADRLRLNGTNLDAFTMSARQNKPGSWLVKLDSRQTVGSLSWQERLGKVDGQVEGKFKRLSIGDDERGASNKDAADESGELDIPEDFTIPGISLRVEDFRLYGRKLGALSLEGARDGATDTWNLSNLSLDNPHASLQGTGSWSLRGPGRGLRLKTNADVLDLGAWLAEAGWGNIMTEGRGTIQAEFEWRDLPWSRSILGLQGSARLSLDDGRFVKLGSRTAKLLELLSLQSLSRLGKLDGGIAGLSKDGFQFDQFRGDLRLRAGHARIMDYKIIGPSATILLDGGVDINDETLDLQAVIVPNLDASGAAIAAGLALNPLVGLGAFMTQWLLREPLANAMSSRYSVSGSWDAPLIKELPFN